MTNSNILIIHNFPVLFSILNEIKSNLNFKVEYENKEEINQSLSKKNIVVISREEMFLNEYQKIIKDYPIQINKLIEIVNIQFLKNKFNQQNNIFVGKYNINLNSRTMSYKNKSLSLTEKETKIITYLNNSKKPITIDNLQYEVWDHKLKLETHTVETHVYRLRKKVESKFNDKFFIISSKNGYKITN